MNSTIEPILVDMEVSVEEYEFDCSSAVDVTIVRPTITVVDIEGGHRVIVEDVGSTQSFDVMDGEDGFSPTIDVVPIEGGHELIITDVNGTQTVDVMDGAGGSGVPDGGKTSQIIAKVSDEDNDVEWVTAGFGIDDATAVGSAIVGNALTDEPNYIPSGSFNNNAELDYSFENGRLIFNGLNINSAKFVGTGVKFKYKQSKYAMVDYSVIGASIE